MVAVSESDVNKQVEQAMLASGVRIYRNNRGVAKFGSRWVAYGVGPNGAGDYIGFLPVRITEKMVGQHLAVFVSIESKRPKGATYDDKQFQWRDAVCAAGGIAGFVHSWEQARALVMEFYDRFKVKSVAEKIKKR